MLVVPLQALPNQVVTVTLGGQVCRIAVQQQDAGMFCNLYVNNVLMIGGVICENINRLVRDVYRNFIGDLIFLDTQGDADPVYTGLGSRWQLVYLEPGDY